MTQRKMDIFTLIRSKEWKTRCDEYDRKEREANWANLRLFVWANAQFARAFDHDPYEMFRCDEFRFRGVKIPVFHDDGIRAIFIYERTRIDDTWKMRDLVLWLLDAFVWRKLIVDGDHAIGSRVLRMLV